MFSSNSIDLLFLLFETGTFFMEIVATTLLLVNYQYSDQQQRHCSSPKFVVLGWDGLTVTVVSNLNPSCIELVEFGLGFDNY